jgi:hypothetical protein
MANASGHAPIAWEAGRHRARDVGVLDAIVVTWRRRIIPDILQSGDGSRGATTALRETESRLRGDTHIGGPHGRRLDIKLC